MKIFIHDPCREIFKAEKNRLVVMNLNDAIINTDKIRLNVSNFLEAKIR